MVNPNHICGNDCYTAGLDFAEFLFPKLVLISAIVKFAHNWKPRFLVHSQVCACIIKHTLLHRLVLIIAKNMNGVQHIPLKIYEAAIVPLIILFRRFNPKRFPCKISNTQPVWDPFDPGEQLCKKLLLSQYGAGILFCFPCKGVLSRTPWL